MYIQAVKKILQSSFNVKVMPPPLKSRLKICYFSEITKMDAQFHLTRQWFSTLGCGQAEKPEFVDQVHLKAQIFD